MGKRKKQLARDHAKHKAASRFADSIERICIEAERSRREEARRERERNTPYLGRKARAALSFPALFFIR